MKFPPKWNYDKKNHQEVAPRSLYSSLLPVQLISVNRPISQIPQCIRYVSHNASFCNRNVHVCTFLLQNGALWDMGPVHCGICATGLIDRRDKLQYTNFLSRKLQNVSHLPQGLRPQCVVYWLSFIKSMYGDSLSSRTCVISHTYMPVWCHMTVWLINGTFSG